MMYQQIAQNRRLSLVIVFGLFVVLLGLGYILADTYGEPGILVLALLIAIGQSLIGYYAGAELVLAASQAVAVTKASEPVYYRLAENLAITAGLPFPRLYIIEDSAINAFATGRDPQHAAIAVTRGALTRLDKSELEGVLAHELAHIQNYDIRLTMLVSVLVGVVVLLADLFWRSQWLGSNRSERSSEQNNPMLLVGLVLLVLAPIAAQLMQLAISRKREFLADASGALLTRYPEGLAQALTKISQDPEPLEAANRGTAHLYIANPLKGQRLASWFSTHPPVEERIAKLRAMA